MKRIRCPKCDGYTLFDETRYSEGQALVFVCEHCSKQFSIKLKAKNAPAENSEEEDNRPVVGELLVLENMFGFKQTLPLHMGENVIGKYFKGCKANCAIESSDPSLDLQHARLTVQNDKKGGLKFVLRDGPSFVGTFVGGEILGDKEQRVIEDGTLFTLGATSLILQINDSES